MQPRLKLQQRIQTRDPNPGRIYASHGTGKLSDNITTTDDDGDDIRLWPKLSDNIPQKIFPLDPYKVE
jgi:hypothetical protein